MKIVVLDGYTLNPGDLNWQPLLDLSKCEIYERTPPTETVTRAKGAEIVLTNKVILDLDVITQLPDLRYIGVLATGINVVDTAAAKERDIVVTNVPAYSTASVVQLTFALLLELTQQVGHHAGSVRGGRLGEEQGFRLLGFPVDRARGPEAGPDRIWRDRAGRGAGGAGVRDDRVGDPARGPAAGGAGRGDGGPGDACSAGATWSACTAR